MDLEDDIAVDDAARVWAFKVLAGAYKFSARRFREYVGEYVREAEHGDGRGYWRDFRYDSRKLLADVEEFIKNCMWADSP